MHFESGKGLWLQGKAAFQMHSFRDAESQPVIPPKAKKNNRISPKELRPSINFSSKPLTTVYKAQHGILVMSVTPKSVAEYLKI